LQVPLTHNPYLYASANPIINKDPLGLQSLADVVIGFEIASAVQIGSSLGYQTFKGGSKYWEAILFDGRLGISEGWQNISAGTYYLVAVSKNPIDTDGNHLLLQYVLPHFGWAFGQSLEVPDLNPPGSVDFTGTTGTLKSPGWANSFPLPFRRLAFTGAAMFFTAGSVQGGPFTYSAISLAQIGFGAGNFGGGGKALSTNLASVTLGGVDVGMSLPIGYEIAKYFPTYEKVKQLL